MNDETHTQYEGYHKEEKWFSLISIVVLDIEVTIYAYILRQCMLQTRPASSRGSQPGSLVSSPGPSSELRWTQCVRQGTPLSWSLPWQPSQHPTRSRSSPQGEVNLQHRNRPASRPRSQHRYVLSSSLLQETFFLLAHKNCFEVLMFLDFRYLFFFKVKKMIRYVVFLSFAEMFKTLSSEYIFGTFFGNRSVTTVPKNFKWTTYDSVTVEITFEVCWIPFVIRDVYPPITVYYSPDCVRLWWRRSWPARRRWRRPSRPGAPATLPVPHPSPGNTPCTYLDIFIGY